MRQEKRKKKGGEKAKSLSQDCCVTFKPKILEILLSAHARTSQADILHLDQKAAKCTTCKPVCGKFSLFIARHWPENHSTSFKTRFWAKSPGANGLKSVFTWRHGGHIGVPKQWKAATLVFLTNPVGVGLFSYITNFFCPINLHRCWPREWIHSI